MITHRPPTDGDPTIEDLTHSILEALAQGMDPDVVTLHEGSETGETQIVHASGRRFQLQLWEIT